MSKAPSETCVRTSTGNRTILVLADSSSAYSLHLPEVLYSALAHLGIPYEVWDLAGAALDEDSLSGRAAIVIAQEHLGSSLGSRGVELLLKAAEAGTGVVNFDQDLSLYGSAYQEAMGLARGPQGSGMDMEGVTSVVTTDTSHFISSTRDASADVFLHQPVAAFVATLSDNKSRVLAESQSGAPLLVVRRVGGGRVVQWLLAPRVWTQCYLGHAMGLDDLFWKGIIWAARKPFVMKAMPPYVRFRFDDCNGLWQNGEDFYFVDVLNEFGHVPSMGLAMRAVTHDGAERIRGLADGSRAEFTPHTLTQSEGLFYGDDEGEYTEEQFRAIVDETKSLFAKWGVKSSPILCDHEHTWSWRVVPFMKELGMEFKMNITMPGERTQDIHVDWRPAPYGSMDYSLDYLPEPLNNLFVVFNHYKYFGHSRSYLPDGRFTRAAGFGEFKWDFLNGLTTYQGQQRSNQIEAAARRLAEHTRLGLDSLFFGGSVSHSHFIRELSAEEWRALMVRYEELTANYEKINVGYNQVAHYARSKVDSHLSHVSVDDSGTTRCRLVGRTTVPLHLYEFRDVDDWVEHRFQEVPVFDGTQEVSF